MKNNDGKRLLLDHISSLMFSKEMLSQAVILKDDEYNEEMLKIGSIAHHLKVNMTSHDFKKLRDHIKYNSISYFIREYKDKHKELFNNDVIGLAFICSITTHHRWLGNFGLIGKALKILYDGNSINPDILVTLDRNEINLIFCTIEEGHTQSISSYIYGLVRSNEIKNKFYMSKKMQINITYALRYIDNDFYSKLIIKESVELIYSEKSVSQLTK